MGSPTAADILDIVLLSVAALVVIAALAIPIGVVAQRRAERLPPSMTMNFSVGTREAHQVTVTYRQQAARLQVEVDDKRVIAQSFAAGLRLTRSIEWTIGVDETHTVRLTKTRRRIYGGQKPQRFVASVDGVTVAEAESRI